MKPADVAEFYHRLAARDPIELHYRKLQGSGLIDNAAREAMANEIADEISRAFAAAEAAPFPEPATVGVGLYAD